MFLWRMYRGDVDLWKPVLLSVLLIIGYLIAFIVERPSDPFSIKVWILLLAATLGFCSLSIFHCAGNGEYAVWRFIARCWATLLLAGAIWETLAFLGGIWGLGFITVLAGAYYKTYEPFTDEI